MMLTALVLAYFLGSIPFGFLLTRAAGLGDIRKTGSGNIGATNVMRTGHKGLGIATLLLDGGKGYFAVWLAAKLHLGDAVPVAGIVVTLGHIFPIWLRFKGGKGVATAFGVFFGIDWMLGLVICTIWILAFLLMRVSSMSSLLSIGYSPIASYVLENDSTTLMSLVLGATIVYTHRGNITRLLHGTESSFTKKDS